MERSQSLGTMRGTWSLESGPRAVCLRVDLSICRVSDARHSDASARTHRHES